MDDQFAFYVTIETKRFIVQWHPIIACCKDLTLYKLIAIMIVEFNVEVLDGQEGDTGTG